MAQPADPAAGDMGLGVQSSHRHQMPVANADQQLTGPIERLALDSQSSRSRRTKP